MATLDITPNFVDTTQGTNGIVGNVTLTHISFVTTLDDVQYKIDLKTNKRDDSWYMDFYAFDGTPLILGIGLSAGVSLLYPYNRYLPVPQGTLFVSPQSGSYIDPVIDSFVQGTHALFYVEAD